MDVNFSVLKNSKFSLFFLSDIISGFGVGMATLGANWYVLMKTKSTEQIGMMLAVYVIAGFIASIFSGVLSDKFSRKTLIFWTHTFRAIGILAIVALLESYHFNIFFLYALAVINGIGWTTYIATSRSFTQEILSEANYVTGNALLEISMQVGMFLAAAIAGFLYKYYSFNVILILNISMFVLSAILIQLIDHRESITATNTESYFQTLGQGFTFLYKNKLIFMLGLVSIVPLIVIMIYNVVLPDYVSHTLYKDSITFGFADMSYGIGGLASGFLISLVTTKFTPVRLIGFFFALATVDLLFLSQNSVVFNLYLCSLLLGLANSSLRILMNSMLMKIVAKEYMGRAMSVWLGISLICQCIFSLSISSYIDRHGAMVGIVIMGLIMAVGLVLYLLTQLALAKRNHNPLGAQL
ncbi:MFS transporter [Celerinatantimonas sp. MCCC 1A17872]|uniref:MFS transporter n=1 Tax=Celerinatantimonas sp. MCCC 1A17872 TaxID=3177514 RepID=UPI0038C8F02F